MAQPLTILSLSNSSHTFGTLVTRVNDLINLVGNVIITTANTANGGFTAGNSHLAGILSAQTLAATTLRGGNVQSAGLLTISGNVSFANGFLSTGAYYGANTSANTSANSLGFYAPLFKAGNNSLTATSLTLNNVTYTTLISSLNIQYSNNSGNTSSLRFIQGNSTDIQYAANATSNTIDITIGVSANAGLGVVGSNTYVQFNDSGSFGANASLTFNKASNTLTVDNVALKKASMAYGEISSLKVIYDTVSNNAVIDAIDITAFGAMEYIISAQSATTNNKQVSKILILNTGTDVVYTEYGSIVNNNDVVILSANANTTHMKLNLSSPISNCSIWAMRRGVNLT